MEIIKNNKGGQKLCYQGYCYTKKAKSKVSQRWECDQRDSQKCRAIATTDLKFQRTAPRFQPAVWNVHDSTMAGRERTNNVCEGWNNGFGKLVGHKNPSIWTGTKYVHI